MSEETPPPGDVEPPRRRPALPTQSATERHFRSGEEVDLTDEEPQLASHHWVRLSSHEKTRRSILIGLTIAFVGVLLLQIGFAVLGGDLWERVGPVLSTTATLVATGFGFAWGHYFSRRE